MKRDVEPMNLEKESKMLEQAIASWLAVAAAILIFWGAAFAFAVYVFKLTSASQPWIKAAFAATVVTAGFVMAAKKLFWK